MEIPDALHRGEFALLPVVQKPGDKGPGPCARKPTPWTELESTSL